MPGGRTPSEHGRSPPAFSGDEQHPRRLEECLAQIGACTKTQSVEANDIPSTVEEDRVASAPEGNGAKQNTGFLQAEVKDAKNNDNPADSEGGKAHRPGAHDEADSRANPDKQREGRPSSLEQTKRGE